MMRISMMNLLTRHPGNAHVKNALTPSRNGGLSEEDLKRRYKVILSNPHLPGRCRTIPS